jgi:rhodanese-related sulfurtransferase
MARNEDYQRLLDQARTQIEEVTPQEARERVARGAVMLDVRDAEELVAHPSARGAKHLSRGRLEGGIAELVPDKATPLVVYCAGGGRGSLATLTLRQLGYANAVNLQGGLRAWKAENPEG